MAAKEIVWRMLDIEAEVDASRRQLPHWDQAGALTFVTFRLADSMPRSVLERWEAEQQDWLARLDAKQVLKGGGVRLGESCNSGQLGGSLDIAVALQDGNLTEAARRQLLKFRKRRWHHHLDACHGRCLLRDPENARIVADSLLKFDRRRYDLERFVVMPNHVHLLVQMYDGFALRKQCEGWLRFTGRQVNHAVGARGAFWQSEPFDHVVRNEAQFLYLQRYIEENPVKAALAVGQYLFWKRP